MNNSADQCTLLVTYTDGSHDEFHFPRQGEAGAVKHLLHEMMNARVLTLQLADRLVAVPTSGIRHVEWIPAPEHLPEHVIRNARRADRLH